MKPKAIVRIGIDIGMTVQLLLLMSYELIGSSLHEWIGLAMFVLFVCHHLLNRGGTKICFAAAIRQCAYCRPFWPGWCC